MTDYDYEVLLMEYLSDMADLLRIMREGADAERVGRQIRTVREVKLELDAEVIDI